MVTWCGWVGNRFGRRAGWLTVRSFVHRSCVRDCVVRVGGESIRAAGRLVGCSFVCSRSCVVAWLHVAWAGEGGGGSIRAAGRLVGCSMLLAFGFAASNDLPRGRHPITISHLSRSNAAHTPLPTHTHTHTHTHTLPTHTHTQEVYAEQIELIRPVVMRQDPIGLFRNRFLSELFDLPYLV